MIAGMILFTFILFDFIITEKSEVAVRVITPVTGRQYDLTQFDEGPLQISLPVPCLVCTQHAEAMSHEAILIGS